MIPILEPAQFPGILVYALYLMAMFGIPTTLLSLVIFFVLEKVPYRRVRLLLPAIGALVLLVVTLAFFSSEPRSPEEYERTWALMMTTGFLLNALVILAPFPFIRRYTRAFSPYLVISFTVLTTFFLLTCVGLMGGDAQRPPETEPGRMLQIVYVYAGEILIAAIVYGGIAVPGRKVFPYQDKQDS
jgi:hypothetical protein